MIVYRALVLISFVCSGSIPWLGSQIEQAIAVWDLRHKGAVVVVDDSKRSPFFRVTEVYIADSDVRDQDMDLLHCFANLDFVEIDEPSIGPIGISKLSGCRMLSSLKITFPPVDTRDLGSLSTLQNLRALDFVAANSDVAELGRLSQIKELAISGIVLSSESVGELQKIQRLERLSLDFSPARDACSSIDLGLWQELTSLNLVAPQLSTKEWNRAFNTKNLHTLSIRNTVVQQNQFAGIRNAVELRSLELTNVRFESDFVKRLAALPKLELVTFRNSTLTDIDLDWLSRMPRLQELVVVRTLVTDLGLVNLKLEGIDLIVVGNEYSARTLEQIRRNHGNASVIQAEDVYLHLNDQTIK